MSLLKRIPVTIWIWSALIALLIIFITTRLDVGTLSKKAIATEASVGAIKVNKGMEELPLEENFNMVAESGELELKLDAKTGHFNVTDKRNGNIWRSYPEPAQWSKETQEGVWRTHLRSPVMFRYVNLTGKVTQPKDTNFLEEQGQIKDVVPIDGGFKLTFDMPSKQIVIPIEVKVEHDSIVTRIIDSGIKEGSLSLVWIRLYPFFGAQRSEGQDGYLFVPDGSGALIRYTENNTNVNRIYQEPVYGVDAAFNTENAARSRYNVTMPVFGAKSGDKGFLTIIEDGAEQADIVASPSGVYSSYNWITAQQNYRSTYKQITNRKKNRSFITYNKDDRFKGDRSVRYLMLDKPKANYVGMAERYRQYLMDVYKLLPVKAKSSKLPMTLNLVGAEKEVGNISTRYMRTMTTSDAMRIVQRLYGLGIDNMAVNYLGWQNGGYSEYGTPLRVDDRIGGDKGMEQFVQFSHTLDVPVYLDTVYLLNNTNKSGYNSKNDGLRDLGGTLLGHNGFSLVNLGYLNTVIDSEIDYYKKLGVDGITSGFLGQQVDTDYNTNYPLSREEGRKMQQSILQKFRDASLGLKVYDPASFALPYATSIDQLRNDYSYDSFSETGIPFAQIALHGLISYTGSDANDREEYQKMLLRDLEYGAAPAFSFIYENVDKFKEAFDMHIFSPDFREWETQAVQEYQRFNEALGDVQDQFITNHRTIVPGVKETTYANGKRIIVNYNDAMYASGNITVKPMDYTIVKGEGSR